MPRGKDLTKQEESLIIQEYIITKKLLPTAKKFGLGRTVIINVLERNNIPRRNEWTDSRKYFFNENYFDNINSEDKAYFLGLITADGSLFKQTLCIKLQDRDKHILEAFKKLIGFTGNLRFHNRKAKKEIYMNQYSIDLHSNILRNSLNKVGIVQNKWDKTYFPNIPEHLWHHFIRGVFDGDGCITLNKQTKSYNFSITGNKELLERIQEILMENCQLNKTKLSHSKDCKENTFSLYYGGNGQCKKIENYLYKNATLFLTRKKEKFDSVIVKNKLK